MSSERPTAPPEPVQPASTPNDQRFVDLYRELRQLADRLLRRSAGAPVSPTTLLHEAYLEISPRDAVFADRQRFFGYAARVMRGLIIDLMRERRALKRGGAFHITQLRTEAHEAASAEVSLDRLSESLDELAVVDSRLAELVDLKYFCGYTFEDIAAQRGTSVRTVQRDWQKARLVLFQKMTDAE
jgi:RNA polymerase sigma factor (TIGR02999 family)